MAICRCEEHHSPPKTTKYTHYVIPIGYPATSTICGISECEKPALVWLDEDEAGKYTSGQRVFSVASKTVKIKACDSGLTKLS